MIKWSIVGLSGLLLHLMVENHRLVAEENCDGHQNELYEKFDWHKWPEKYLG
jgi:hypothetical protein